LPAQIGELGVGLFELDDFGHGCQIQGLDIGDVGHPRVGHDGGRVGVGQNDLIAELAQGLAGLCAGIVEFTGLADDNRAGANDHYLVNIGASGHEKLLLGKEVKG
jgi:hypothetical protein